MISAFQTALIELLENNEFKAREYFGEFADKSKIKTLKNELPMILIDYVQSNPHTYSDETASFNLYIINASYSKNRSTRSNTHLSTLGLLRKIKRTIVQKQIGDSDPISIQNTRKMLDAAVEGAYLTVYTMNINAVIYDTEPLQNEGDITQ